MADFPALPLFTDSLVADTDHLTDQEFGAYLRMLIVSWRSSSCDMPNDMAWITRRFIGCREAPEIYEQLIKEFFTKRGTRLQQKRLLRERNYVENKSAKQSARAKSRWQKENDECRGNAAPHASGSAPTPTPLPIPIEESVTPHTPPPEGGGNDPRRSRSKRGTRLPDSWVPSEQNVEDAIKAGIPRHAVAEIGDQFRDYWIAVPGQRGTKLDWDATWRNRCKDQAPRFSDVKPRTKRRNIMDEMNQEKGVMADAKRILQRASAAGHCRDNTPVGGDGQTERAEGEPGSCAVAVLPDGREVPIHGTATDGDSMDRGEAVVPVGGKGLRGRATNGSGPCDSHDRGQEHPMEGDQEQLASDVGEALGAVVRATAWRA